jgi:hypothetical protein
MRKTPDVRLQMTQWSVFDCSERSGTPAVLGVALRYRHQPVGMPVIRPAMNMDIDACLKANQPAPIAIHAFSIGPSGQLEAVFPTTATSVHVARPASITAPPMIRKDHPPAFPRSPSFGVHTQPSKNPATAPMKMPNHAASTRRTLALARGGGSHPYALMQGPHRFTRVRDQRQVHRHNRRSIRRCGRNPLGRLGLEADEVVVIGFVPQNRRSEAVL